MSEDTNFKPISVRVAESKREKWEDYVEESDAQNLSHLVRIAVKHEIDGKLGDTQEVESTIASEQMSELVDGINDLQSTMEEVQQRISSLESEVDVADTMDIEDAIYNVLPVEADQSEPHDQYHEWAMTVEDIAIQIARPEQVVKETLERMEERGGQVRSVFGGPDDGEHRYFLRE
jgi:predicted  nucleic acid-binding Zn-ribbon protein